MKIKRIPGDDGEFIKVVVNDNGDIVGQFDADGNIRSTTSTPTPATRPRRPELLFALISLLATCIGVFSIGVIIEFTNILPDNEPTTIAENSTTPAIEPSETPVPPTQPTILASPTPAFTATPESPFIMLPLNFNADSRNSTNFPISAGVYNLYGIDFNLVSDMVTTGNCPNSSDENTPNTIEIETNINAPMAVYFIMNTGNSFYNNTKIGEIILTFSDEEEIPLDLIIGVNIRDWWFSNPYGAVATVSASYVLPEAISGNAFSRQDNGIGGADILALDLPAEYQQKTLTKIQIVDTSHEVISEGRDDPCIHLLAVTVKKAG